MAFTQEQLDALEEAIASSTLEVQYKDKKVTYRSMAEMLRARDLILRKLGKSKASAARVYPTLSKGLNGGSCD